MFVKPVAGRILRHPQTKVALPPEGGELPNDFALRRIRDGDAVSADPPAPAVPRKSTTKED